MPLLNATPIPVTYRDGRTETLTLGELSIRNLYVFIHHLGGNDTPALVALCVGKPVEWIDTLTDTSFDALVAESIRLNFPRATERMKNDPVALGKIGPLLFQLEGLVRHMPQIATLGNSGSASSPPPAPSASAAATGSASST